MAFATPTRRALVDLDINKYGTPSAVNPNYKEMASKKRSIREVEQPELPPSSSRARISPLRSERTFKTMAPQDEKHATARDTTKTPSDSPKTITPDTPEPSEVIGEDDSQKDSVSSVNDFDPDETNNSQQTAATEVTQPIRSRASVSAEVLRLRLRLAQFRIRTNQVDVPFSQLRISPVDHNGTQSPPSSPLKPDEEQPSLPRLLPAPVLQPTAYSARTITRPQIPSSPPSSTQHSPDKALEEIFRTPALPRHAQSALRQTNSSPESRQWYRRAGKEEESLTSSVIRGKAAIGLLGLRGEQTG